MTNNLFLYVVGRYCLFKPFELVFNLVAVFVVLFLANMGFPWVKSIPALIPSTYSNEIIKMVRKLGQLNFKLRKTTADIHFSCKCKNKDIIIIFCIPE